MNSEVTNIVNTQLNPRLKKIEASLVEVFAKIDKSELSKVITERVSEDLSQRLKDVRTLKVRKCSKDE